ncbi:hypothetical protein BKA83DRAFT_4489456 [Pisolithus microcarpus]|nr:hypothetical protein BKA83DRAFT_4489456 [Pisolithus microcarpus]
MPCEGGVNPPRDTSISLLMENLPEPPAVADGVSASSPCAAGPKHGHAVILHEESTNTGDATTRDVSLLNTHTSRLQEPPHTLNNASWMSRNPGHPVIPPRSSEKLDGETHYRNRWEESLANALVCIKACQVNANHPHGQKFQLKELQEMVANDPEMQNLDEETKQKYLGELKESHGHKAKGVRSTNTVASCDVQATLKNIYEECLHIALVSTLAYLSLVVMSMTHMVRLGSENIMDFWEDRMNLSPDYIIKQLELWACNEEKNVDTHDSLENMQKQSKSGLDSGFSTITKHLCQEKPICLQFANFEQIKYKFGIDYEGWPDRIPFSSPYKIQTIDEIRHFQHQEYCKQVDARHKAGKMVSVPHQGHSDKGKKHKTASENDSQPSKKVHRTRAAQKSWEIIETSDEDSDGGGDHF